MYLSLSLSLSVCVCVCVCVQTSRDIVKFVSLKLLALSDVASARAGPSKQSLSTRVPDRPSAPTAEYTRCAYDLSTYIGQRSRHDAYVRCRLRWGRQEQSRE